MTPLTLDALAADPALAFGQYLDAETFFIGLQAGCLQTPDRDALLTLIASIKESAVRETVDDGVAQQVKTSRGVALMTETRVPNPVRLAPYRTFREVEQPASLFVVRLQGSQEGQRPKVALFEAEGGAWRLTAIQRVAVYLRAALDGLGVSVLA